MKQGSWLYPHQNPHFLCPCQGEGSTEWVGTADPGRLWGSLSFSRYKGKVLTSPLHPIEGSCWKLFRVVGFDLILHLNLLSFSFRSSFRKQRSLPSYRVLGVFLTVSSALTEQSGVPSTSPRSLAACCAQKVHVVFRWTPAQAACWHVATKFISGLLSRRHKSELGLKHQMCFPKVMHPNVCKQYGRVGITLNLLQNKHWFCLAECQPCWFLHETNNYRSEGTI